MPNEIKYTDELFKNLFKEHVMVCSKHFTEDCFVKSERKFLFREAIPALEIDEEVSQHLPLTKVWIIRLQPHKFCELAKVNCSTSHSLLWPTEILLTHNFQNSVCVAPALLPFILI